MNLGINSYLSRKNIAFFKINKTFIKNKNKFMNKN